MRITVTGTSRIRVPAEGAQVTFTVGRRGTDNDAVIAEVGELTQKVRTLLDELTPGDDGDEARLSSLRTWTDFTPDQEPVHVAHVDGSVTVWELSDLGQFLAQLASIDGVTVDDLQWKLAPDTRDAVEPEAIRDAFQDARQRARWIAHAAGRENPVVLAITDAGATPIHFRQASMRAGGLPALELDPVDVEISISLTVEFEATG